MPEPNENTPAPNPGTTVVPAGGEQSAAWIPEALRGNKSITKFKDPGALAESYVNLEKMVGSRVEIPGDDAAPEVKAAWRTRLGVPDAPGGYDKPAVPEGITLDTKVLERVQSKFHELGVPKAQAKQMMDWYIMEEIERANVVNRELSAAHDSGMTALNQRWGAAAPRQIALSQRVVAELGGSKVQKVLNETGVGSDPDIVEFLAKIGGMMEEDNLITPVNIGQTKEQAVSEIAKIRGERMKDKKHPLNDKKNPGHSEAVEHFHGLYKIAYPEQQNEDGT